MSLITEDARAWIGRQVTFICDPIPVSEARRFVAATGDDHPRFPHPHAAGIPPAADTILPPMLYYGATRPFAFQDDFAPDGTVEDHRPIVGTGQTMGGTLDIAWARDLRPGDRLSGTRTLMSLEEKAGRNRAFVLAVWLTEYTDETGATVVEERYEQILF